MNTIDKLKQAHKGKTATRVFTIEGHENLHTVQYHNTRVFTVEETSQGFRVWVNHGGYVTKTTAKRINDSFDALGIRAWVNRSKGEMILTRDVGKFSVHDGYAHAFEFPTLATV